MNRPQRKILMFGDRYWNDVRTIREVFKHLSKEHDHVIIHGACTGADSFAGDVAKELGHEVKPYPADWENLGRSAGPRRNREMLKENPDIDACIGFHNDIEASKGTKDMHEVALKKGFKSKIITSLWPIIDQFKGDFAFLSNFYMSPMTHAGVVWPSLEHAYQACKTLNAREREFVHSARYASEAKRRGGQITVRHDWDLVKVDVMHELLRVKFMVPQNRDLLLATDDSTLVEGNYWGDTFWGICKGVGKNHLGNLLMNVRDDLQRAA